MPPELARHANPDRMPESGGRPAAERSRPRPGGKGELLYFPIPPVAPVPGPAIGEGSGIAAADLPPDTELVSASLFGVLRRLIELLGAFLYFQAAGLLDVLVLDWREILRRGSFKGRELRLVTRRAVRLRRILQWLGGTFIKVGQQLAIRSDVLPPLYCRELGNLLDSADPLPEAYVRETLESQQGEPIERIFSFFNFTPIGRASIACVYRARLRKGTIVAVKVRRPGIVRQFKTDLAALDFVLRSLEFITVLRPRVTETLRSEMRLMLLEELDFRIEARYQELFKLYFKKRRKLRTTAPKVYPKLCGREVIVSEFVTGIWLKDMIAGLESGGEASRGYRARLRALDINPKKIARQLVRGSHYGFFECPFFHGDPHPGNVLVQPHNRIVMVDFGACGVFARRERYQLAQMHHFQSQEDIGGMVQCVIGLMEPLPPIDIDPFRRKLEDAWWKGFYGIKSRHSKWWERTSFRLWSSLLKQVREAQIPLPLSVLRMIRATLLYDTVAARLYGRIDVFKEYRWYFNRYARRVREDINESIIRQLFRGPDPANYVRLARLWDVGNLFLHQAELFLRRPLPDFSALVSKGWEILKITLKWVLATMSVTLAAFTATAWLVRGVHADPWTDPILFIRQLLNELGAPRPQAVMFAWLFLLLFTTFKYLRSMWFRLSDKDVFLTGRDRGGR